MRSFIATIALGTGIAFAQVPGGTGAPGTRPTTPGINPDAPQPSVNTDTQQMRVRVDDKKFLRDAAMGGLEEVELGKLAAEKGGIDAIKQFGQKMVDDHTKAGEDLKQVASAENINIPDALDAKHQARIDKLSKLSGAAFDRAYIKDQVKDHEQDVREFQNDAQNGNDTAVKEFASRNLPTLQQHLTMAKDLNKGNSEQASADRSRK